MGSINKRYTNFYLSLLSLFSALYTQTRFQHCPLPREFLRPLDYHRPTLPVRRHYTRRRPTSAAAPPLHRRHTVVAPPLQTTFPSKKIPEKFLVNFLAGIQVCIFFFVNFVVMFFLSGLTTPFFYIPTFLCLGTLEPKIIHDGVSLMNLFRNLFLNQSGWFKTMMESLSWLLCIENRKQ